MKKIFLVLGIAMLALGAQAQQGAPAYRGEIERIQPNGDTLYTYLRGDERSHYAMTIDGWQIKENDNGYLCYAMQKRDGSIVASRKVAHNEADRKKCEKRWLSRKGIRRGEN